MRPPRRLGGLAVDIESGGLGAVDFKCLEDRIETSLASKSIIQRKMLDEFLGEFLGKSLTAAEWRWNEAFKRVLGVSDQHYAGVGPERRRWLEHHYEEVAQKDTRRGRKAAKVVAVRAALACEDAGPEVLPNQLDIYEQFYSRTMIGRSGNQQNIMRSTTDASSLKGMTFDHIIVDELWRKP